jgi:hypothetical protein
MRLWSPILRTANLRKVLFRHVHHGLNLKSNRVSVVVCITAAGNDGLLTAFIVEQVVSREPSIDLFFFTARQIRLVREWHCLPFP